MGEKKYTQEERDKVMDKFMSHLEERASDGNSLRERNRRKMIEHTLNNKETKGFRESMKRSYGIDPVTDAEAFPVLKESFSWNKFREQLHEQLEFREADTASAFPLFLIAGLLQNVIGMYQTVKVTYMDWVHVTPTNLKETPVAPLHGLSFPREVGEQMPYPVSRAAALSLKFVARKYGTMYEVTKELLEDDQSGQFKQQTGALGEYLQLLREVLCYGRLASVSGASYQGYVPGVSETKPSGESSYPWSTSLIGGGANRPSSFGALTDANLKKAFIALGQQKNLLGILMNVLPNRIICGVNYQFDVAVLLNSAYYPAGAQSAGVTGGAFSINPLKGIADATVSKYLVDSTGKFDAQSKAWYLVDDSKPWFQLLDRTPVSVEQEAPNAGESFSRDVYRFKANTRCIADFVDPRFAWQGSDGSV